MSRGKLRIYLGAAPGVGKTYAMLNEGWRRRNRGTDVVVGFVETHGRENTAEQVRDLPIVPRVDIEYRGQVLEEMDVDAILARKPAQALVDELAHTNVPGSHNEKRWQDIDELLAAGIDVISTVNIQHLESLNDVVARITGITQRETVPDAWVRAADQIELVDMTPEALRRRMAHGNVYASEKVDAALGNYFRPGNLAALRELALLWLADRVDEDLAEYRTRHGITEPWETRERVVVALTGAPGAEHLLRRASRMATRAGAELIGVHVRATDGYTHDQPAELEKQRDLLEQLGGRYAEVASLDVAEALLRFARTENATQLLMGATAKSRWAEFTHGSIINRVVRGAGPIDVHVISPPSEQAGGLPHLPGRRHLATVPPRRRHLAWFLGTVGVAGLGAALSPLHDSFGLSGALLFLLLAVFAVAAIGGAKPAIGAAVVASLTADYFFTRPVHSFRVASGTDVAALFVFFASCVIIAVMVDLLARRTLQVSRGRAESEALARLAGGSALPDADALPELVGELRRTFDLDGVAVLVPQENGWEPLAAAGEPVARPEDAAFSAPLDEGAVLALAGTTLNAEDTRLLAAFVAQLRRAQERARLQADAATAKALAEADTLRTALLRAVSHDLRTPVASIKAAASAALVDDVDWTVDDVKRFCKTIDAQADHLTSLINNLLDMSRLQVGAVPASLEPTVLEDVLYAAISSLPDETPAVTIDIGDPLPLVVADPGLLERALANILVNAQMWSPADRQVRIVAGLVGDRVDVRVIDQGPGIQPDQRERVFQPFQRLGDRRGSPTGIGLGLAVAKGFAEAMGATLGIEDTPGGGTTVVFGLQRADQ